MKADIEGWANKQSVLSVWGGKEGNEVADELA